MIYDITGQSIVNADGRKKIDREFQDEQSKWKKIVSNVENRKDSEFVKVMHTPNSLKVCEAMPDSIYTPISAVKNMLADYSEKKYLRHSGGHNISKEELEKFPVLLREPLLVIRDDGDNTMRVITSGKSNDNKDIVVAIALNRNGYCTQVNKMSTAFGTNDISEYISARIKAGDYIAAVNEKADKLLDTLRSRNLSVNNYISFNENIPYLKEVVNVEQMKEMGDEALVDRNIVVRDS